jgi:hypothetical protein
VTAIRRFVVCGLSLWVSCAAAQKSEQTDMLDGLHTTLVQPYTVSGDLAVDPSLREAAKTLFYQHHQRMRALMDQWAEEERRIDPKLNLNALARRLMSRYYTEFAWWQLDSAGSEADLIEQTVAMSPSACYPHASAKTFVDDWVYQLSRLPPHQRAAAIQAQAQILGRWGTNRTGAASVVTPSIDERAWRAIDALVRERKAPALPLTPILAWQTLGAAAPEELRSDALAVCALRQWNLALERQERGGPLPSERWSVHRQARMKSAMDWFPRPAYPPEATSGYPEVAQRLEVEGVIRLEVELDAQGRFSKATVVRRTLTVPGVRDQRPIAHETLFDDWSIERARKGDFRMPAQASTDGRRPQTTTVEYVYRLE